MDKPLVIDTHTFYGKNAPLGIDYPLERIRELQRKNREPYALRFLTISASPENNAGMADLVQANPGLLVGAYLQIVPKRDLPWRYTAPDEIAVLAERREIRGLKVITSMVKTPIDDAALDPFIEIAEDRDIPLLVHCCATGSEYTSPERYRRAFERHPKAKWILAHAASLNPDFIPENFEIACMFPNIFLNSAGMSGEIKRYGRDSDGRFYIKDWYTDLELRRYWKETLRRAMSDEILSQRFLFGTDFPELGHDFHPFNELPPAAQQQMVANSIRLFKLESIVRREEGRQNTHPTLSSVASLVTPPS